MERNVLRHSMVDDQSSSFELIFVMLLDRNHNRPYGIIGFCKKSKHPQFKWSANIHHRFLNVVERVERKKGNKIFTMKIIIDLMRLFVRNRNNISSSGVPIIITASSM
nr:uncharacterized protein LOC109151152 [Ipomoea batatas]